MMKKYIAPEFRVAMFHKETVSTNDKLTPSTYPLLGETAVFMEKHSTNAAKVQKSINFNNAIKFN